MNNLLRNAVILDIETTSLARGSGIHELAMFDIEANHLTEYILEPNLVNIESSTPQDISGHAASVRDRFSRKQVHSWYQAITDEVMSRNGIQGNRAALYESLRWRNPFLHRAIFEGKHPHLSGMDERMSVLQARDERFRRFGVAGVSLNRKAAIEDVLKSDLPDAIKGKTVWIANTKFEASQVGAQLAASEIEWKSMFETANLRSPDPFYVTGRKVNEARVTAQITGDWRNVWKSYIENVPKAGETAVRDIQDVLRSMQSYGRSLGVFGGVKSNYGAGIDIASQLFALAEGNQSILGLRETHRAAEDVAIHENYVLKKAIQHTSALQAIEENTPEGKIYREAAKHGQGPLAEVTRYFSLLEQAAPQLQRASLLQRLGRAYEDIVLHGETYQVTGIERVLNMKQSTPSGEFVNIPRVEHKLERFTDLESVVKHLTQNSDYSQFGINIEEEYQRFKTEGVTPEKAALYIDREIEALRKIDFSGIKPSLGRILEMSEPSRVGGLAEGLIKGLNPKKLGMAAAGLAAFGAAWSLVQDKPKPTSSVLGFNYYDWLEAQEGMVNQGWAKENRSKNTDFGSPYRGPVVSSAILEDQKILAEREKYLRQQYNAQHYDPVSGLFGITSYFRFNTGYRFIGAGQKVDSNYRGMQGNNLVSLKLDDGWKISAEDADTITVKRGGIRGAITSFFGMNRGYSFRLAGIDAPETSHKGRAAQPYAEEAKQALVDMIAKGKEIELVYSTKDPSYGRMMGGLFIDGQNINYELVRQGQVAHLPYGKAKDAIINYQDLAQLQEEAFKANKGLWSTGWGQAFYQISRAIPEQPTFNTLADPGKLAASASYSMMSSIMENNQPGTDLSSLIRETGIASTFDTKDNYSSNTFINPVKDRFAYRDEMMLDTSRYVRRHGDSNSNTPSHHYGKLNQTLALDSLGTTNNVHSRTPYAITINKQRRKNMGLAQRDINNKMFVSPIGHYRM